VAALLLAALLAGCSGVNSTADSAYKLIRASRPEAAAQLVMPLAQGTVEVELVFPEGYGKSRRWPACMALVGPDAPLLPDMRRAAASRGFVVAFVRLPEAQPDVQALTAFSDELLARLRREYAVDSQRFTLYARGELAFLASELVCERSHLFAGLALVDGGLAPAGCRPVKPIPVVVMSSSEDSAGGIASFWAHSNGCQPMPDVTRSGTVERQRYHCPGPGHAVQRYVVRQSPASGEPFDAFPAAWTVFEFLARQSDL